MTTTTYQKQYHSFDGNNQFDVNGEIIHVVDSPKGLNHGAEVLVELPEDNEKEPTAVEDTGGPFCTYQLDNGGRCSREVDREGERCWQHPHEEDE